MGEGRTGGGRKGGEQIKIYIVKYICIYMPLKIIHSNVIGNVKHEIPPKSMTFVNYS